jgi:MinD superfamily P-loop ATPase
MVKQNSKPLQVAVASGKGGTDKTLVATHLAVALHEGCPTCTLACPTQAIHSTPHRHGELLAVKSF